MYLGSAGHRVLLITSQFARSLKGDVSAPEHEQLGDTEFFRPYRDSDEIIKQPGKHWDEVRQRVVDFKPDAVIGFGEFNYRLPLKISREFNLPYHLFLEYLQPGKLSFPMRGRTVLRKVLPWLHDFLSRSFLDWLAPKTQSLMCSYYADQHYFPRYRERGIAIEYVPWCTEVGELPANVDRNRNTGIYVGSLAGFKNAAELVAALPLILAVPGLEKFTVIGPGEYAEQVKALAEKHPDKLEYKQSVPRSEAMAAIASAGFGYTPVTDCGLGFIGDCWGLGTPLVATHALDGFLKSGEDTLLASDYTSLPGVIAGLLDSESEFQRYSVAGQQRYRKNYTAEAVGERYLSIVRSHAQCEREG